MREEPRRYDVCAFSDALTDIIYVGGSHDVSRFGLVRGRSVRLSPEQRLALVEALEDNPPDSICAGGSPSNTLCGLARLGLRCAYIGLIGDDRLGRDYLASLAAAGVEAYAASRPGRTGSGYTFVDEEGERSFGIDLGVADELQASDLTLTPIAESRLFHTSAYQLRGGPEAAEAVRRCVAAARSAGTQVSLDLGDAGLVDAVRGELSELLSEPIDVLQANIHEARAFLEDESVSAEEAARGLRRYARCVTITRSAEGCVVAEGDELHSLPALPVRDAVDFNGAGDAFGAGLLFGRLRGMDADAAASIGLYTASLVIRRLGAQWPEAIPNIRAAAEAAFARAAHQAGETTP